MIDYLRIFESAPAPFAIFEPHEYRVLAANDAFLANVGATREELLGKCFDEAFPADPEDAASKENIDSQRRSLDLVKNTLRPDRLPLQRYPVRKEGERFEERYWSVVNAPVTDAHGRLEYIVHRAEEVTNLGTNGDVERRHSLERRADRMEAEVISHAREVSRLNSHLNIAQRVARIGSWQLDIRDRSRTWSDETFRLTGLDPRQQEEGADLALKVMHPDDLEEFLATRERFIAGEGLPAEFEHRIIRADNGEVRRVRERVELLHDADGKPRWLYGTLQDITEQHNVGEALRTRARQQSVVAELGQIALTERDPLKVYEISMKLAAETLDVEYSKVLKLLPEEKVVKLMAGVGWREGLVGKATVGIGKDSQAGYTLQSDAPVIVEDLETDTRFNGPALLREHNVVSGMSVIIHGEHGPWGVLGVHTTRRRKFDHDDVSFVQSVANIIAEANRRAETEASLMRSEERTRKIIENSLDAVIAIDADSCITEWNPQAETIFGYKADEVLGKPMHKIVIPPEFRDAHLAGMKKFLETGEGVLVNRRIEVPALHRDGYEFPVELAISVLREQGTMHFSAFLRDISERKQADAKIRESEERFRMVAKVTADTIWDWNLVTDAVWWNEGMYTVFGYRPEDVEPDSRSIRSRIHPDQRDGIEDIRQRAVHGDLNEWYDDFLFRRADGSYADIEVRGYVVRDADGSATRMVGGINDVTVTRERESRLKQQAALLDKAQDAIIVSDMAGRITFWNKGAERLYGWNADEITGKRKRELLEKNPDEFDAGLNQTLRTGEWSGELVQKRKDGGTFTVESALALVSEDDDRPRSILCINTDITERLALEEQLRQSQRLEAVGQLTGGIAHDFNNLLTVILGNAELMADQLPAGERLHKLAEMTRNAATRGAELTHGLLAFARRQALEPRAVDVNRMINELQGLLTRAVPENVEISVRRKENLWGAFVDPAQLESVLLNLVLNAKDAMAGGGGLMLETDNVTLDEDYAARHAEVAPGRYVMIAVSDTGTGIPPEVIDRVFDPFFTTKEQGKGTGLGLSMAYGFAKQSGGHIKIYSEPEQGTTVKLYLPRAVQTEDIVEASPEIVHGGGEKVLVVEDDDLVRVHAESQLEVFGYDVVSASSGPEALDIMEKQPDIELLFTDVIMSGGMNGPELAKRAKQLNPELKVLYTSGYTENAIVHHGRLDEGVQLLQKPYRRHDLARKVRTVLSQPADGM